jgi:hypothetical protein
VTYPICTQRSINCDILCIPNEVVDIVSVHRTTGHGVAVAGGVAHLPGMVVAMTPVATNGSDWLCDKCWFAGGTYFVHQSS